jgi:TatD DNase family protein
MNFHIIDTHTHCYFPQIEKDFEEVSRQAALAGVGYQVQIGCDEISSLAALKMAQENQGFFATLGLHPCDVKNVGIKNPDYHRYKGFSDYDLRAQNLEELFDLFAKIYEKNSEKIVGFGETGFDLYHENSDTILALQKESFSRHLDLCERFKKPFVMHSRNATDITIDFLREQEIAKRGIRGIWHCFCEDSDTAKIATEEFNLKLGIGGVATYNNTEKLTEAILNTPLAFLVTETDSPFLMPRKAKNKKLRKYNTPEFLPEIVEKIAEIKNMDVQVCGEALFENGCRVFGLNIFEA